MRRAPVPEMDCTTATYTTHKLRFPQSHVKNTHRAVVQRLALHTVRELRSSRGELGETADGKVLLVRVARGQEFLGLLDTGKHVRLTIAVTVRADSKVDLAGILVSLECFRNTYNKPA